MTISAIILSVKLIIESVAQIDFATINFILIVNLFTILITTE